MTSTKRQANLGSAPPMSRVEWAIARYNWYRACGLLSDSPRNNVSTPHERSPDSPQPKPHLKWYPLSKPDDDLATTYQPPAASTQRHRYSQRVDAARYRTEAGEQAKRDDPRTWSRVDWAIARYEWYRACGLLGDSSRQTAETTDSSAGSLPPKPHLKWYPLNTSQAEMSETDQRSNGYARSIDSRSPTILTRYEAPRDQTTTKDEPGNEFDPSKHPRAERGQRNGGQFVKGDNQAGQTPKPDETKSGLTPVDGTQGQAHFSVSPEKSVPKKIAPESIPDLLEQFPLLPGETLEQLLSNLGYSLDGPKAYQAAWRSIVMRKIGITPEQLASYRDFQLANQRTMKSIYSYYQSLYNSNPELLWAGMAKVAGNAVWDGLNLNRNLIARNSSAAGITELSVFFERELVRMNKEIFEDLAWVHEAYRSGGMREIDSLHANGALSDDVRVAFGLIDEGVRTKDDKLIQSGNEKLLRREQSVVLERGYRELTKRNFGTKMGALADNPIPGGRHFGETVNGGSMTKFEDRWAWIKKEMIWRWNTMSPAERAKLVNGPLGSSDSILQHISRRLSPSGTIGHDPEFETMLHDVAKLPRHRMTPKEYEALRKSIENRK